MIGLEILIIFLLVLANGVFAMAEISVVSSRKARLQQRADEGSRNARVALQLANNPGTFLATVQIGITLIGILAGTFGGVTLSRHLADWLEQIPVFSAASNAISVGIVVLCITYLSLIIGELVPKRIGLGNPEGFAALVARPMHLLSLLARPAVWFLEKSTNLVLLIIGYRARVEEPVSEEEIKVMLEQGADAGVFHRAEEKMVKGVFRLADRRVEAIMTTRTEIDWLNLEESLESLQQRITESPRSRFPVARGGLDQIIGIVETKKLLGTCLVTRELEVEDSLEKPMFVPESLTALELLDRFRTAATHTALVVDEFGSIVGLVTPYDVMHAIIGELPQKGSTGDPNTILRDDGSWLVDGLMMLDEFHDHFRIAELPGENSSLYSTIGGYVVAQLGRLPETADKLDLDGWSFEVVDMDGHRIDKLLMIPPTPEVVED